MDELKIGDWVTVTAKNGFSLDGFPLGDITWQRARVDSLNGDSVRLEISYDEEDILIETLPGDIERVPDGAPEAFRDLGRALSEEMENPEIRLAGNGFFAEFDPLAFSGGDEAALRRHLPNIADDTVKFLDESLKEICGTFARRLRGAGLDVPDLPKGRSGRQEWADAAFQSLEEAGRGDDFYPSYSVAQLFVEGDRKGNGVELLIDFNGAKIHGHHPNPDKADELVDELWRQKRREEAAPLPPLPGTGKRRGLKAR